MFDKNRQNKLKHFFAAFFLASFAVASVSLAVHGFSHKINFADKNISSVKDNFLESSKFVTELQIFANDKSAAKHDLSHCSLCFLSIVQNNILFLAAQIFTVAAFSLFLVWRNFNRVKLAYLSSSFLARAPPFSS